MLNTMHLVFYNHRIIYAGENLSSFRPSPFPELGQLQLYRIMALSSKVLCASKGGNQTASLGNLFQGLIILRYSIAGTFNYHLSSFAVHFQGETNLLFSNCQLGNWRQQVDPWLACFFPGCWKLVLDFLFYVICSSPMFVLMAEFAPVASISFIVMEPQTENMSSRWASQVSNIGTNTWKSVKTFSVLLC